MVGCRYIIVNTLHKGDNKDDDDDDDDYEDDDDNNNNNNHHHHHHHHHDAIICGHRTAATLYTLETWFVLGI
jgi:ABC-type nickel/cobalt efflux system permease component RcnA